MQLDGEAGQLLALILEQWNKAEADIKIAGQVASKVVNPSIKELRYAGRRIVDALVKAEQSSDPSETISLLRDALFDCHRARHDAIDAATSKIALDLDIMRQELGADIILQTFPRFTGLVRDLNRVRVKIAESRGNRENREAIYSAVEVCDLSLLVANFSEMRESEPLMIELAKKQRRTILLSKISIWVSAVFGLLGVLASIYFGLR